MLPHLILVLVCLGGVVREGWWVIPIGTMGLCAGSLIDMCDALLRDPSIDLDWANASRLLQGFCNALATCAAIYLIGAGVAAVLLGGF